MRVISKARLRQFWERLDHEDSEGPLKAWYKHVSDRSVSWRNPADVKADIASASVVGDCVVFNIAGNKYRLITRILYVVQKVFVLKIMTHEEYDENKWKKDCGCFEPPPARTKKPIRPSVKKPHRRKRR